MKKKVDTRKDEKGNSEFYAYVNDANPEGMSHEEALEVQEDLLRQIKVGTDVNQKINAAAQLMLKGFYRESIEAYNGIAEEYPDERGVSLGQNGASYYFLGQYEKAIECYREAIKFGADEEMMKDNIEEAEEALGNKG